MALLSIFFLVSTSTVVDELIKKKQENRDICKIQIDIADKKRQQTTLGGFGWHFELKCSPIVHNFCLAFCRLVSAHKIVPLHAFGEAFNSVVVSIELDH